MNGSTRRRGPWPTRMLRRSGIMLLPLAVSCSSSTSSGGDPSISAKEDRSSAGVLEALTVKGEGFTANGQVLVTTIMAATGGNASPYVEETIQADASGNIQFERRPVSCPQPANYQSGSWISVVARDMSSGISGSDRLDPGGAPDCRGG